VPSLRGRTLILLDVSGSMVSPLSGRGTALRWEAAAAFAAALAIRAEKADLVAFQSTSRRVDVPKGASILRLVETVRPLVGGGTNTFQALREHYDGHDRVAILTDEQAFYDDRSGAQPGADVKAPIYTFNLAGYQAGHLPSGGQNRYTFGGLTDQVSWRSSCSSGAGTPAGRSSLRSPTGGPSGPPVLSLACGRSGNGSIGSLCLPCARTREACPAGVDLRCGISRGLR
jgi:hypothetical protein